MAPMQKPINMLTPVLFTFLLLIFNCCLGIDRDLPLSSFHCVGELPSSRRCYFSDVLVVGRTIWFISEDNDVQIPRILCSAVDHTFETYCHIRSIHPSQVTDELKRLFGDRSIEYSNKDTGLAFGRLNPSNLYHTLFEDVVPIYQILKKDELLSDWLSDKPKYSAIIVNQDTGLGSISFSFWSRFFPQVSYIADNPQEIVYRVKYLVAGVNNSCAHYYHCSDGRYTDPNAVTDLRQFLFEKVGVVTRSSRSRESARVVIIQRGTTRKIRNIDEITDIVSKTRGKIPEVVDLAKLSFDDQIKLIHDTDILIMIHGGALAHLMFMAEYATLFEFYPFSFPYEFHGLVNWVRYSMRDVSIRHHPFDIRDPRHMFFGGGNGLQPLPLCLCDTSHRGAWYGCSTSLAWSLAEFLVDSTRFEVDFSITSYYWEIRYPIAPPLSKDDFRNFSLALKEPSYYPYLRREFNKENAGTGAPPLCHF